MKKSKKIVLVDDDNAAHIYHKLMLKEVGVPDDNVKSFYTVDNVLDYLQSLITAKDCKAWPNYIFIDINMPLKTGFDFVEEYQELNYDCKDPKIYFVSNTTSPMDVKKVAKMELVVALERKFLGKDFFATLLT